MNVASQDAARRARYAVWVAFIAAIGGFLFGYDLALTASANRYLVQVFKLPDDLRQLCDIPYWTYVYYAAVQLRIENPGIWLVLKKLVQ